MSDRLYSRKEVAKILDKATQVQLDHGMNTDHGLSEKEIVQIAKDAGIEREAIVEALHTFEDPAVQIGFSWLNGTSDIEVVEYVNREVDDLDWTNTLNEIRKSIGPVNVVEGTGVSYEAEQLVEDFMYKHISLVNENGKTRIEYSSSWPGMKAITNLMLILLPTLAATVIAVANDFTWYAGVPTALAGGFFGLSLGRLFLKGFYDSQKRKALRMMKSVKRRLNVGSSKPKISIEEESEREGNAIDSSSTRVRS